MVAENLNSKNHNACAAVDADTNSIVSGFSVQTIEKGYNGGRVYRFRFRRNCDDWIEDLTIAVASAKTTIRKSSLLQRCQVCVSGISRVLGKTLCNGTESQFHQEQVARVTDSESFKQVFALVIGANFITYILESQLRPDPGSANAVAIYKLDVFFTAVRLNFSHQICLKTHFGE